MGSDRTIRPNTTDTDPVTLVELLRRRAAEGPDSPLFGFLPDGEEGTEILLTRGGLDLRARALAARLQGLGLAGERALLLYPPGLEFIVAFFGCLYARVVAVPAHLPRPNRPMPRLRSIVEDARPAVVLTCVSQRKDAARWSAGVPGLEGVMMLYTDESPAEGIEDSALAGRWIDPGATGGTLAFLQYTSGSTATPRGVMLTQDQLMRNGDWIARRLGHTADSRGVIWLPPYHDMGLIGGILQPLQAGFPCYLMSPVTFFSSPFAWLRAVSRFRGTTSGGPNFAYELCVRRITAEQRALLDLSSWRVAFTGAEPVRSETLERFAECFAPCGFRPDAFLPCYGLAESTLMVSGGRPEADTPAPPRTLRVGEAALESHRVAVVDDRDDGRSLSLVGCGAGLDDHRIEVVEAGTSTRCGPGRVGEIWVAGPCIARGYWGRDEESRRVFGARLADTGEGPFLRTGDLGFVRDGEVFVTGRLKDLIILRGRNLYPHDLERTAERCHPDLQPGSSAAFSIEDEEGGGERLAIAAETIPHRRPDLAEVAEAVRRGMAEAHEAELSSFVLLQPGGLPKTSSGKIQRRACREAFLAGTLRALGSWHATGRVRPEGPVLSRSAVLALPARERRQRLEDHFRDEFARVLHLDPTAVDPRRPVDSFGLDSLATVQLRNALEAGLGVAPPVSEFLRGASIAELTSRVLEDLSAPPPAADGEDVTRLLRRLEQLSDDEVAAMLHRPEMTAGSLLS
jgi:acyl-CoA synthetase (AMP-forming)/AMP-acid ligase II/acyl carrier protein